MYFRVRGAPEMPTTLNWSEIDPLIKEHLPSLTCVDFCKKFPFTIPRTIGQRAKFLGIKPKTKVISNEHKLQIGLTQSKYKSSHEIDNFIIDNNGKFSIIDIACNLGWSPYAVRKRAVELGLVLVRVENRDPRKVRSSLSSSRVDWSLLDNLLIKELPNMTIRDFQRKFLQNVSDKAIGKRAKKLNIVPADYKPDDDHRQKIRDGVREYVFGSDQDEFMINNVDRYNQDVFADLFGVSKMAIWRRMGELGLKRDDNIILNLSRIAYKLASISGNKKTQNKLDNMSDEEYVAWREKISRSCQLAFKEGRIKPRFGIGKELVTKKGGSFRTRSSYETRYVEILEEDDNVVSFEYEPFEIEYEFDGIKRIYNPDFLVIYNNHAELVEVKPLRFLDEERNPYKFMAAERYCLGEGIDFVVVTEEGL
jgi:hypothetical protein